MKHMENKLSSSSFINDDETIADQRLNRNRTDGFLVSKFMYQKKVICEKKEQRANEIENVDATLQSLIKSGNMKHVENVQNEI
ncbi:hypothetical protein V6N13_087511 [Hibiscus sabdariffa]|uniref:Uncharacterized protein n=1 Tax=Hibiscus sabdariffa TaxID=183260 RepID=A0ABR2FWH2_9ROSI